MRNNIINSTISLAILFIFIGCGEPKDIKASRLDYEGVEYSMHATDEFTNGNTEMALRYNQNAIDKFLAAFEADSTYQSVRNALGYSYWLRGSYEEGIYWYEKANIVDTSIDQKFTNYLGLGLCRINLNQIERGKEDLEEALKIKQKQSAKNWVVSELRKIWELAIKKGEEYDKNGNKYDGEKSKQFALKVFLIAYNIDSANVVASEKITGIAAEVGDTAILNKLKILK